MAALVVGTILNLINQGDVLWADKDPQMLKMALTYLVPYCVATYGAVTARRRMLTLAARREAAAQATDTESRP